MKSLFASIVVSMLLVGSANAGILRDLFGKPLHWTKPGANQETFMRDRYVCLQQAQQNRSIGSSGQTGGSFVGIQTIRFLSRV